MLSYPCSEVMPTTLSTAELKEQIAQEVERCQLCTAEQEDYAMRRCAQGFVHGHRRPLVAHQGVIYFWGYSLFA